MELPDIRAASRLAALVMRPIAIATLGGNLLPGFMRRADPVVIYVQHRSVMAGVFRDEVLFRFKPTAEGFTARRDRRRAFALLRRISRSPAESPRSTTAWPRPTGMPRRR